MEEKKKTNKIIPVILGIIIVLLIGLIVKQVIEPNNDSMNNNEENNKTAESTITKSEKESIDNILNHYIDAVEKNAMVLETKYYENFSDGIYELPFDQVSVTLRPESGWFSIENATVKNYSFVINGYVVTLKDNEITYEKGNKEKSVIEVLLGINEKDATKLDVNSEEVKKLLNIIGIELETMRNTNSLQILLVDMKGKILLTDLSIDRKRDIIFAYGLINNLFEHIYGDEYDFCSDGFDGCLAITIDEANRVAKLYNFSSNDLDKMFDNKEKYNGMYLFKNEGYDWVVTLKYNNIVSTKINEYIIISDNYDKIYHGTTTSFKKEYIFRKNDMGYYLDTVISIKK